MPAQPGTGPAPSSATHPSASSLSPTFQMTLALRPRATPEAGATEPPAQRSNQATPRDRWRVSAAILTRNHQLSLFSAPPTISASIRIKKPPPLPAGGVQLTLIPATASTHPNLTRADNSTSEAKAPGNTGAGRGRPKRQQMAMPLRPVSPSNAARRQQLSSATSSPKPKTTPLTISA